MYTKSAPETDIHHTDFYQEKMYVVIQQPGSGNRCLPVDEIIEVILSSREGIKHCWSHDLEQGGQAYNLDCVWTTLSWQSWTGQTWPQTYINRIHYPNNCLSVSTLWIRSHELSAVQCRIRTISFIVIDFFLLTYWKILHAAFIYILLQRISTWN